MSVSRGNFLKALGKSLPGMMLGGGMATAAQAILKKVAAASGDPLPESKGGTAHSPASSTSVSAPVEFFSSGPVEGRRIALTFDDGPTAKVTERILEALEERQLRATFFMIGQRVIGAPDLARRVLAEGHEVGNHTFSHAKLTDHSDREVDWEIQKTQDIFEDLLSHRARWFRPPFGALRQNQGSIAAGKGLDVVLWSVDSRDWTRPSEDKIVETVLEETTPGAIILCHDLHAQTASAMGRLLDGLLDRGFSFVGLNDLLRQPGHGSPK